MTELRLSRSLLALGCGGLAASALAVATVVLLSPDFQAGLGAAFFFGAVAWAVLAYAAGGTVGTWEAPTFISSLTGIDPAHVKDLREKLSGPRSDVMLFAGLNALVLFLSGVLINLSALAASFILLAATLATAYLLASGGPRPSTAPSGP